MHAISLEFLGDIVQGVHYRGLLSFAEKPGRPSDFLRCNLSSLDHLPQVQGLQGVAEGIRVFAELLQPLSALQALLHQRF